MSVCGGVGVGAWVGGWVGWSGGKEEQLLSALVFEALFFFASRFVLLYVAAESSIVAERGRGETWVEASNLAFDARSARGFYRDKGWNI